MASEAGEPLAGEERVTPPRLENGLYGNPSSWATWSGLPGFWAFLRWRWESAWGSAEGGGSRVPWSHPEVLDEEIPVRQPAFSPAVGSAALSVTWIGHATVLLQMDGVNVVCDPIWSQRCSPLSFAGPKRYRQPPCAIADLPPVHVGLISHNHYDHLDKASVRELEREFGGPGGMEWFVPAGLAQWMRSVGGCHSVTELSWGEEGRVLSKTSGQSVRLVCLPAQHWSLRSGFDRWRSLWSGWGVIGPHHRFFFAGDTGYTEEFQKIGRLYGPFDLAAIPVGCYCPRNFMASQHTDPEGAVRIHRDLRSERSLGIHWGTFEMGATEHYLEPRSELRRQVEAAGLKPDAFITTAIGHTWRIH